MNVFGLPVDMRLIMTVALLLHGIGHSMGVMVAMGVLNGGGFATRSWLFSDKLGLGQGTLRLLSVLWITALAGFVASAAGLWMGVGWWRPLTMISMLLSVGLFASWWDAFPSNIPIQANIGNAAAIIALIFFA